MKILPLIVLIACVAWQFAVAQDESESRAVPARGLLKRGPLAKGKTTTTSTTTPAEEPEESEYEDSDALYSNQEGGGGAPTETPTSTEGKKLAGNGVRPFRSNADLLEALKRRRAQAAEAKLDGYESISSNSGQDEIPTKGSYNKKRPASQQVKDQSQNEDTPVSTAKPLGIRGRFTRPPKSVQENEQQEQDHSSSTAFRSGRTFRRGGN